MLCGDSVDKVSFGYGMEGGMCCSSAKALQRDTVLDETRIQIRTWMQQLPTETNLIKEIQT